ncbi:TIR domain-containing protein [Labedaea rhizosphaerae]|uniref:O-acetyl-ADP-ribose deacetylase (Regulator of RNase III) n=1 Tax=Labedaea rhizosphaerae TaxID=598644 RepID=A0A4R6S120_LABRH|nr:TIR domain-containing protein [Labedaea rhizosphaerae]TDP92923.1 O-acetyl-ADP-ribose deacetylase (regulator of RNase III) [Labedaea rhizosphaerae]
MPFVFINYRVRDQSGYAALLYRELVRRFGPGTTFLAASSIDGGADFQRETFDNLRRCRVLLAVIGSRWNTSPMPDRDWVHEEIAEAWANDVRVVPVLIEDAELPDTAALPQALQFLTSTQYVRIRHYTIDADLEHLTSVLRRTVPELTERPGSPSSGSHFPVSFGLTTPAHHCTIGIVPGDIRRVRSVDIWVNSENTDMQMARITDFSISAIIRYLGAQRDETGRIVRDLIADELEARVTRRPVAPGTAVVTSAGSLAMSNGVRHLIHVAAVQGEPGDGYGQVRDIGGCVRNVLARATSLAEEDPTTRRILFPLFGVGVGGAPVDPTARAMLSAVIDFLTHDLDTKLTDILFLAFTDQERRTLEQVMCAEPLLDGPR